MVALDTIEWNGLVFGHDHDADAFLDEGVAGFGHGMHRLPRMDRLAGGQALGISAPGAMVPEADLWVTTDKLAVLRSRMEARPMPSDLLPLSWRGLGWPADVDLCVYAKPLGFDFEVSEDAKIPDALAETPGVVSGIRCMWVAPDPTVYELTPTTRTQNTATSSVSWSWTNPGLSTPLPGMGGQAWTLEVTAATTTSRVFVQVGSRKVTFKNLTLSPGQKLRIGPDRIARVGTAVSVGFTGSSRSPRWPILPAGQAVTFVIGCESGTFTASGEFRGTW